MTKKFTKFQVAALKRIMKNLDPLYRKRNTILAKLRDLNADLEDLDTQIQAYDTAIVSIAGDIDPKAIIMGNGEVEITRELSDPLIGVEEESNTTVSFSDTEEEELYTEPVVTSADPFHVFQ